MEACMSSASTGGAACPLCAPARVRPTPPDVHQPQPEPVRLDEAMVWHFGIAEAWVGWPVCVHHLREYQKVAAKAASAALRREQHQKRQHQNQQHAGSSSASNKRRRESGGTKVEVMEVVEAEVETRPQPRPSGEVKEQEEEDEEAKEEQKTKERRKKKKTKGKAALDPVPLRPIGLFESCFLERHGTPRQGLLVPSSRGKLTLRRSDTLTNPQEALLGLEGFSHVWIVFLFHNNAGNPQNKIQPPRLGGRKLGMLATRTPHRPCPIGLSVARVESIEGDTLHLSGVDLVNNTPVLDVKPYIKRYDAIPDAVTADWLVETDRGESSSTDLDEKQHEGLHEGRLRVAMTDQAIEDLRRHASSLRFFKDDWQRAQRCIEEVLALDIRTLHMKRRHKEGTYGVSIDLMNVSFTVDSEAGVCTVQRIDLWPESYDFADFSEVKRRRVAGERSSASEPPTLQPQQ